MKMTWIVLISLAAAQILAAPAALAVTPGKVQTFKDWTVGCDNGLDCQAVALMDEKAPDNFLSVVVSRPAGPGTDITVEAKSLTLKPGRYQLRVDGRMLASGAVQAADQPIRWTGASAMKLARAMARGNVVRLSDGTGTEVGKVSLAGSAAALRYIDGQQGRSGVRNAIVATSGRPKAGKRPALPIISARKITPNNILPDTSALVALSENSPCAADRFGSTQDTAYSLGNAGNGPRALVLINCGAGAYNFSSGVYTGRRDDKGAWTFAPATFDYGATGFTAQSAIPILVNARWDAGTQTITSYSKARGLGDCGSSETYVWDGQGFRLTAASFMGECRGSTDWIPTWRAEVRLVD
jgi:hypothetical protein